MRTHTFANLMLTVYEILELNKKNSLKTYNKARKESKSEAAINMRDQRELSDFSSHQLFFAGTELNGISLDGYNKFINIIDNLDIFTQAERRDLFYKYEQLYNALISTLVPTQVGKKTIIDSYTALIIPAILALDMHRTLEQVKEGGNLHFYQPIQAFLLSEHYPTNSDDPKLLYQGLKYYLKNYIKNLEFHPDIDFTDLYKYIDNIRVGINQKNDTIIGYINIYKSKTKKLSPSQDGKLDKLRVTYTSLNTLLAFQNKTGFVNLLSLNYHEMMEKRIHSSHLLSILNMYLYTFDYNTKLLQECVETIIYYANFPVPESSYIHTELTINTLKNVVFENSFETEKITRHFYLTFSELKKRFNEGQDDPLLNPYSYLLTIIDLLRAGNLKETYKYIETEVPFDALPFGYLASAISIIYIALKIKLKKNIIKNGTLIPLVNTILETQGVFTDLMPYSPGMHRNPIIKNANNFTIMRSIRLYNTMIEKITPPNQFQQTEANPLAVSDLLDDLEITLAKFSALMTQGSEKLTSEAVANSIIKNKLLTPKNMQKNLISILNQSTLHNCVICLVPLSYYLGTNGKEKDLKNIIELSLATSKRELLCQALSLVTEKLSLQSGK
ncbi:MULTISPECIES: hypothetical protein [Enterobacterales]|uniref:Uncharacterized protein n=4 Tax=Providencia TaxID=586 RepID=A0A9N8D247_PRORE|nr:MULTISPECIES: hypothetical protein [Providencia]EIU7558876.1 hypothetical protein [Providencia rettgeri]ELR5225171.1 hypothetical protein [Providencia rettgeri]EMB0750566.1 hypothetical protein [Providencia rettgeri]MBP6083221.1 hypothetical protein [Providencia sp.]MCB4842805.1 hypothetical protein [Providencia rettgeri]